MCGCGVGCCLLFKGQKSGLKVKISGVFFFLFFIAIIYYIYIYSRRLYLPGHSFTPRHSFLRGQIYPKDKIRPPVTSAVTPAGYYAYAPHQLLSLGRGGLFFQRFIILERVGYEETRGVVWELLRCFMAVAGSQITLPRTRHKAGGEKQKKPPKKGVSEALQEQTKERTNKRKRRRPTTTTTTHGPQG